MKQLTLIALYKQKKTDALRNLIRSCQEIIRDELGELFQDYEDKQIHATIVGLEQQKRSKSDSSLINRNFRIEREKERKIDFSGLLKSLEFGTKFPFQIQIGGFDNRDYPFTSRDQRPYERSFSIQGNRTVIIGWPIHGEPFKFENNNPGTLELIRECRIYTLTLDEIRRSLQTFGILHQYHKKPADIDNDFYFRIGLIKEISSLSPISKQRLESSIRQALSRIEPIIIDVTLSDLRIACYEDDTLPLDTTPVYEISEVSVDDLEGLCIAE